MSNAKYSEVTTLKKVPTSDIPELQNLIFVENKLSKIRLNTELSSHNSSWSEFFCHHFDSSKKCLGISLQM